MKHIYLVRHAKSSWADYSIPDHDRPLNERGKRDAPFMAAKLLESGQDIHAVLSSTARRARKTATAFRKAFELEKDQMVLDRSLYHAMPDEIIKAIQALPDSWTSVAVFGHNPGFTDLANRFPEVYIDNVPTCGILGSRCDVSSWMDWSPESAEQLFFYYPKIWLS